SCFGMYLHVCMCEILYQKISIVSTSLNCTIAGEPPPAVAWLQNGRVLTPSKRFRLEEAGKGTYRLCIEGASILDAGTYTCIAENKAGVVEAVSEGEAEVSSLADDLSQVPLREELRGMSFKQDEIKPKIMYKCATSEFEKVVDSHTEKTASCNTEGHHSLIIQNVGYSDSGTYWCKATNSIGETVCKSSLVVTDWQKATTEASGEVLREVALSAAGSAPQKFNLLVDSAIPNGNQTEIELEFEFEHATDDSQKAVRLVAVTKEEQEVEGEKCISINFDVFAEPAKEEGIEFTAEASESCSFEFQVTEAPPRFIKHISDCNASEGASACFQCLVDGSPKPSVSWYKDGVSLQGERYFVEERQTGYHNLIIGNLIQSDAGEYKCMATNKAGAAETSAVLTISRLSVVVTGSPKPKVEWFFGGVKLMSSTDYTFVFEGNDYSLIIPYARAADQGEYTCTASNRCGETACSAYLKVEPKELSPVQPPRQATRSNSVSLPHPPWVLPSDAFTAARSSFSLLPVDNLSSAPMLSTGQGDFNK
uniref:Ig-like domain-containing protein n=1 Tax=Crocodylus porosus TaxID=8502 RepID=A0A7M4F4I3_CROPO